jgi:hypothetical protein
MFTILVNSQALTDRFNGAAFWTFKSRGYLSIPVSVRLTKSARVYRPYVFCAIWRIPLTDSNGWFEWWRHCFLWCMNGRNWNFKYSLCEFSCELGVSWLRRLVLGLSLASPGFDPRWVHLTFLVDRDTWTGFPPVSIIPTVLLNHIQLHVSLIRRTNWCSMGKFQNQSSFGKRGPLIGKVLSLFFMSTEEKFKQVFTN